MGRLSDRWRSHLLTTFSGDDGGRPYWVEQLAEGDDAGFFGPSSASWAVTGGIATLVAGIRALLMQTLHPGAMAGVHDHSRYREDPLGRLSGTIRWLVTVTFADTAKARLESSRVSRFHDRVVGTYPGPDGRDVPYAAGDQDLLRWVHVVFTDAFLGCETIWGRPIPGGADGYVREWATAGELVGVVDPPTSAAGLAGALEAFRASGVLRRDARVDEAVRFIRSPPLHRGMLPAYRVLFAGAVASLPVQYRRMLGLRRVPGAITATRILLRTVAAILGGESTSEAAARSRIARLGGAAEVSGSSR